MTSTAPYQNERPTVAITGVGVVTSLGVGMAENWPRLVAGHSGVRAIRRFPTDGLRTTIAGTVDAFGDEPYSAADLSTRMAEASGVEAMTQAGLGGKSGFPGRLVVATPPSELEWPHLFALNEAANGASSSGLRPASRSRPHASVRPDGATRPFRQHRRPAARNVRLPWPAAFHLHRLRLGRDHHPDRRRSPFARRNRRGPLHRRRRHRPPRGR